MEGRESMTVITMEDFEVVECVTHYFQHDNGKWLWHCLTCNTGSNKYSRHSKGHKLEGDAATGAKYHTNAKRMERRQACYRAWWWREIMTTRDSDHFMKLWISNKYFRHHEPDDPSDLMSTVQSDNNLWNYMLKLNPMVTK
jgi:hypothetical protein